MGEYPALVIYQKMEERLINRRDYLKHKERRNEKRKNYSRQKWEDRRDNPKFIECQFKKMRDRLFKSWVMLGEKR